MQGCDDGREALRPLGSICWRGVAERLDNLLVFSNDETCSAKERSRLDALPRRWVCCSSLVDILVVPDKIGEEGMGG
jgi:hypothetical protein